MAAVQERREHFTCIARLSARVQELQAGRTEADAAREASALRARAMRSEADAEYDRRAAARSAARADDIARRNAMDEPLLRDDFCERSFFFFVLFVLSIIVFNVPQAALAALATLAVAGLA